MKKILILGSICAITTYANAQSIASKSVKSNEILPSYTYFKNSQYRLFYHVIKVGETPESIGNLYGLSASEVMKMNNLTIKSALPIGQELLLEDRNSKQNRTLVQSASKNVVEVHETVVAQPMPNNEVVVSVIKNDFENADVKILQIEGTTVAKPSLVHFIETEDIESHQKQAIQEGKLLFLNFYAHWCVPCAVMQESTFRDQDIADVMDKKVISLHINGDTERGKLIKLNYAVSVFPTLLFFDKNGNEIARHEGALGIEAFRAFMNAAIEKSGK